MDPVELAVQVRPDGVPTLTEATEEVLEGLGHEQPGNAEDGIGVGTPGRRQAEGPAARDRVLEEEPHVPE
ncbi:MAG TPA: hypothetical protein VIB78_14730, partial [Acidimicrobiia bacterium]